MSELQFWSLFVPACLALYGVALVVDMLDIPGRLIDVVRRYREEESRS